MAIGSELKIIMNIDDSEYKKVLESVAQAEKSYFQQAKNNQEQLIVASDKLTAKKVEQEKKLTQLQEQMKSMDKEIIALREKGAIKDAEAKEKRLRNLNKIRIATERLHKKENADLAKEINLYKTRNKLIEDNRKYLQIRKDNASQVEKSTEAIEKNTHATTNNLKANKNLTNDLVRHLRQIETLIVAYYALSQGYKNTLGIGIEVNKMIEDNTSGIAALLSANTQMVLSNGQVVTSYEKFQMGQKVAAETMEQLKTASVDTYATFPQLTQLFQQSIGHTLAMGKSFGETTDQIIDNTVALTQRISNIAGSIGMPMERAQEEIRSLLSGNVSTDSLIAVMLFGSPSKANEAMREAKKRGANGVKDMLDGMLKPFDVLKDVNSYTRSLLELENAWATLMQQASEPLFDELANAYRGVAEALNEISGATKTVEDLSIEEITGLSISKLEKYKKDLSSTIKDVYKELTELRVDVGSTSAYEQIQLTTIGYSQEQIDDKKAFKAKNKELGQLLAIDKILRSSLEKKISDKKITDDKLEALKKQSELLTKIFTSQSVLDDVDKFTKKEESELSKLYKQKEKWEIELGNVRKNQSDEVIKDIENKKTLEEAYGKISLGIAETESKIATIKLTNAQKQLKLENQKTLLEAEVFGTAMEKSDLLADELKLKGDEYLLVKGTKEEQKVYVELLELTAKYNKEITKEQEKQYTSAIKLANLKSKRITSETQGSDAFISPVEYGASFDEINNMYASMQSEMVGADEVTQEKFKKGWSEALRNLESEFKEKTFEIDVKLTGFDEISDGIAGIVNGFADIANSNAQLATQEKISSEKRKDYNESIYLSEEERKKAYDDVLASEKQARKMQSDNAVNQIGNYANMTGAMANFYDEDDDRKKKQEQLAKVLHASQMALQIASLFETVTVETAKQGAYSTTALAASLAAPFPANIVAFASVAAMIASLGIAVSGSGGSGGGSSAPDYTSTIASASFGAGISGPRQGVALEDYGGNFDKFIEGLDSAAEKLENYGNTGTATGETLSALEDEIKTLGSDLSDISKRDTLPIGFRRPEVITTYAGEFDITSKGRFGHSATYDGKNFGSRTEIGVANQIQAYIEDSYDKTSEQISEILFEELSENLDYSAYSTQQLLDITQSFNEEQGKATEQRINDIALLVKQGDNISNYEDELSALFQDEDYKKLVDYGEALDIVNEDFETSEANIKKFADSFKTETELLADLASGIVSQEKTTGTEMQTFEKTGWRGIDWRTGKRKTYEKEVEVDVFTDNSIKVAESMEEWHVLMETLSTDFDELTTPDSDFLEENLALIKQREADTYSQLQFADSLKGTSTALDFARLQVGGLADELPTTIDGLVDLRQAFIDNDGKIDTYEQSIIDATLATAPLVDELDKVADSFTNAENILKSMFSTMQTSSAQLGDAVNNITFSGLEGQDAMDRYIMEFNTLTEDISGMTDAQGNLLPQFEQDFSETVGDLTQLSQSIADTENLTISEKESLTAALVSELEDVKKIADLTEETLSVYVENDSIKIDATSLMGYINENEILPLPSFAVGTTSVPRDMIAQIHQGEAILPKTFNEGIQSGSLTLGNNQDIILAINNLSVRMDGIAATSKATSDILSSAVLGGRPLKVKIA